MHYKMPSSPTPATRMRVMRVMRISGARPGLRYPDSASAVKQTIRGALHDGACGKERDGDCGELK